MSIAVGLGIAFAGTFGGSLVELAAFRKMGLASLGWPRTEARITRCAVALMNGGSFYPEVTYAFSVDGQPYVGEKLAFRPLYGGQKKIRALAARYPVGARVQTAYAPSDPHIAVLEPGPPRLLSAYCLSISILSLLGLALGLAFVIMGFVLR